MTEQSTAEAAEQGEQGKLECALRVELLALVTASLVAEQVITSLAKVDSTLLHSLLVRIC